MSLNQSCAGERRARSDHPSHKLDCIRSQRRSHTVDLPGIGRETWNYGQFSESDSGFNLCSCTRIKARWKISSNSRSSA